MTETYLCQGNFQSACYRQYEDDGDLLEHHLVGGGTLWECHGTPEGELSWENSKELLLASHDIIAACYPARIKANYGYSMALPDQDGEVQVGYRNIADDLYLVVVAS